MRSGSVNKFLSKTQNLSMMIISCILLFYLLMYYESGDEVPRIVNVTCISLHTLAAQSH